MGTILTWALVFSALGGSLTGFGWGVLIVMPAFGSMGALGAALFNCMRSE